MTHILYFSTNTNIIVENYEGIIRKYLYHSPPVTEVLAALCAKYLTVDEPEHFVSLHDVENIYHIFRSIGIEQIQRGERNYDMEAII